MKSFVKRSLPFLTTPQILRGFWADFYRYVRYTSCTKTLSHKSRENIQSTIVAQYHALEKGLCMPDFRWGFGNRLLKDLLDSLYIYVSKYGYNDQCIYDSASAINEYLNIHASCTNLLDQSNIQRGKAFVQLAAISNPAKLHFQDSIDAHKFFINSAYYQDFALSRRSCRYFDGSLVPIDTIIAAIEIARYAPSSCNRQTSHVHIFQDKTAVNKLLELQGGNRGFGHLGGALLLITSDVRKTIHVNERHMPFVDGGIFYMSLIYALHAHEIASCPLNCYFPPNVEAKVRKTAGIQDYECIIAMLLCGRISGQIKLVKSPRLPAEYFYTIH